MDAVLHVLSFWRPSDVRIPFYANDGFSPVSLLVAGNAPCAAM